MFRTLATTSLGTLVIGAAALAGASLASPSDAQAYDGRYERGYERPYGWRPSPPAFHGYWGHRRWQRWHDERRFYGPPPAWWHEWR